MSYEIIFTYRDKDEEAEAEAQIATVKVGKIGDEVSLDAVAGTIFARFARRTIIVDEVEIYEYAKKKVAFRETDEGLVIRGKKFPYDAALTITAQENEQENTIQKLLDTLQANPALKDALTQQKPLHQPARTIAPATPTAVNVINNNARVETQQPSEPPMRVEVFAPDPDLMVIAKEQKIPLTPGTGYPIYGETKGKTVMDGMLYEVVDDNGYKRRVSDRFFVMMTPRLSGEGQYLEDQSKILGDTNQEPQLAFQGESTGNMPNIRG